MLSELTQLLARGLEKGKSTVVNSGDDNEDPAYLSAGTSSPMNYPTSLGSNPRDNPTNPVVHDLEDIEEVDKARVELPK
ncbi:putative DNA double-strand break repair Rad50 ATPase [Gossypium australe]|uniref:Putative DNA double-strand break repair Rad50 ATPase n=1 Tax=Gossypium australe TaxID=47621 RepID=A0A5B6WZN8_9ROSI|nr:putative DNA double-strand break repair Rad50 ATPase [Gossypium australe]